MGLIKSNFCNRGGVSVNRRTFGIAICIFIIMSTCSFTFKSDAYNNPLRIGLRNMTSNNINIVLNGNYILNNSYLSQGTSFGLGYSGMKITYNGAQYDELTFTPQSPDGTIRLEIGAKKYNYKGIMTFKATASGILPINIIDIEEYLKGVVAYEMSNSYPIEALKAQAVAARNYALTNINKHRSDGYDLCDTTDCQVYKGYNATYTKVIQAVEDTKGKILIYGDGIVSAYYAASSGGYTEASGNIWNRQLPYLISKKDDFENENWPFGDKIFTSGEIESTLKSKNYLKATDKFEKIDIDSIVRNVSGRVASIDILYLGSDKSEYRKSITKEGARTFLSLPSTLFYIVYDPTTDSYTFSGKGYGHGVGMSQVGAKNRANAGQGYDSILYFYYDGTSLVNINNNVQNYTTGEAILVPIITTNSGVSASTNTLPKPVEVVKADVENTISEVPPKSQNSRGTSLVFTRELKLGMKGSDVKNLQEALKTMKCFSGNTTTLFGSITQKAVKTFQEKQGIKVSGVANRITLDVLSKMLATNSVIETTSNNKIEPALVITTPLKKGMKGTSVKSLQTALKNLGYYKEKVNGVFDVKTFNSVKTFQKTNGIASIGTVGPITIKKINEKIVKLKVQDRIL